MKIQLSENEVYEIKLPEMINKQEFSAIVSKFNALAKNFVKFDIGEAQEVGIVIDTQKVKRQYKTINKTRWQFLRDNRSAFIDILLAHYHGTKEELEEVAKSYGISVTKSDIASNQGIALREMHKVKAEEMGLKSFPTRTNHIYNLIFDNLKGKNYKEIKETLYGGKIK